MAHTIGKRLKELRENRGLSQRELAKLAGVSEGYVSHIESGFRLRIGVDVAKRLATALGPGIMVDDLLSESDDESGDAA